MYPKVFVGLARGSYRDIGCEVPLYPVVMAGKFIRELYRVAIYMNIREYFIGTISIKTTYYQNILRMANLNMRELIR